MKGHDKAIPKSTPNDRYKSVHLPKKERRGEKREKKEHSKFSFKKLF